METLLKIWNRFGKQSTHDKVSSITHVAVFGFADAKPGDKVYQNAYEVCFELAKAGYVVVDGGGPGVMEAATRGAKAGGGKVIGVTFYPEDAPNFEGRDLDNPIDEEIKTKSYVERTLTLLKYGQVYVVFNGASGTMSEFSMAWGLARIYLGHHKPIILYGGFWRPIMSTLKKYLLVRKDESKVYKIVTTPKQVLKAIKDFDKEIKKGEHSQMKTTHDIGDFSL